MLAGVGGILVGLAPADLSLAAHGAGALLQVPAAVGPLLLGMAARSAHLPVTAFSLVCGVVWVGSEPAVLQPGLSWVCLGFRFGDGRRAGWSATGHAAVGHIIQWVAGQSQPASTASSGGPTHA